MHSNVESPATLRAVPAAVWERLADRRIFFGHQSVGGNLVAGIERLLAENPTIRLRIVHAAKPAAVEGPAFIDFAIGRNGDPASKDRAFAEVLLTASGSTGDLAMYKYCYVDFTAKSDAERIFADYRSRIRAVRERHPGVVIVHMTTPLTTDGGRRKELIDRLLARSTGREVNGVRNHFNDLMLREYTGVEPVFDLAGAESTRPDGSRAYVRLGGRTVYTLAPELSDDGGHLNELGQRLVAERFLLFLAGLAG